MNELTYRVERCIDSPEWVWTVMNDGEDYADGYGANKAEATRKAKQFIREENQRATEAY